MNLLTHTLYVPPEEGMQMHHNDGQLEDFDEDERNCKHISRSLKTHELQKMRY